jgi:N-acetylmuramoyl-L-alanine amidase
VGAELFISIHNDSNYDHSVMGTTLYVCDGMLNSAESRRFAALALQELTQSIGTTSHGIKDSELYVVRESSSPAVLIETMFMSNAREEAYLRQPATWDKAAAGVLKAVQKYFAPGV